MRYHSFSSLQQRVVLVFGTRHGVGMSLCLMGSCLALILFAGDRLMGVPFDFAGWLELFLASVGFVSWGLLRFGRYGVVAWLMVASLFLMTAFSVFSLGSARSVNVYLLVAGQVVVGLFLSQRALIWTTVAAVAMLCGFTLADTGGWLHAPTDLSVGWRTWGAQAAALVGVSVMVYANRTQLRAAQAGLILEAKQRLRARVERDDGLERFRLVFGSSPTPIFVQSFRTGSILDANPAFEAVTGYTRKEVLNRRDGFLWEANEQLAAFELARRKYLRTDWLPINCKRSDGVKLPLLICSEIGKDEEDGLVITVLRQVGDDTDRTPLVFDGVYAMEDPFDELDMIDD